MSRRPQPTDDDGGLDSLLDTMTNVVGILVLVLIMTQLGVSDKVARITAESDITAEDVADARRELEERRSTLDALHRQEQALTETDPNTMRQRLQQLQDALADRRLQVKRQTERVNSWQLRIETDRRLAETRQKEIDETDANREKLADAIRSALERRAELAARLEDAPQTTAPPDLKLRIPWPRPAPEGAQELTFVCSDGRLYPIQLSVHQEAARLAAQQIIAAHRLDGNPAAGIDPDAFTRLFTKLPTPPDEFFRVEYTVADRRWPRIRFLPRDDRGASERALRRSGTRIRKFIRSIDPQKVYCRFHVLPDSYSLYITARRIVTNQGLQAGWEPRPEGWVLTVGVPGIRLGPPPPPSPPSPKTSPRPPPSVID